MTTAPGSAGQHDAELAFALALAVRAGDVLMAHYERLEQIDYKSARDVVTEADHLSEALILDAIRAALPGRRDPGRGDRRASRGRGARRPRPAVAASGSSTRSTAR